MKNFVLRSGRTPPGENSIATVSPGACPSIPSTSI
jgi:hypothetical protein